ncbi:hypothetical protein HMPREF3190_00996 [Umbribacter vaginalis]|nr:hypothetical protein HMPREF3190_00996 [Coriobacteriales bacterium DNF00809]
MFLNRTNASIVTHPRSLMFPRCTFQRRTFKLDERNATRNAAPRLRGTQTF